MENHPCLQTVTLSLGENAFVLKNVNPDMKRDYGGGGKYCIANCPYVSCISTLDLDRTSFSAASGYVA